MDRTHDPQLQPPALWKCVVVLNVLIGLPSKLADSFCRQGGETKGFSFAPPSTQIFMHPPFTIRMEWATRATRT